MHICKICCYKTNRKSNYEYHTNRKNPCKPSEYADSLEYVGQKVNAEGQKVNAEGQKVNAEGQKVNAEGQKVNAGIFTCEKCQKVLSCEKSLKRHHTNCQGINNLQCPTCLKFFESRKGKNQHIKNVKCGEPPEDKASLEEEIEKLRTEVELLKSHKPIIIHNTTNNNIQINSYDKPSIEHITNNMIMQMFYGNNQDAHLMLGEAVRQIYKNEHFPENDSIKLIEGSKSAFAQVQKGKKQITLPALEVLETLLTKSSEVCGDGLRDCEGKD